MINFYKYLLELMGTNPENEKMMLISLILITTLVVAVGMHFLTNYLIKKHLFSFFEKTATKWDDYMIDRNLFKYINALVPLIILEISISRLDFYKEFFEKTISVGFIIIIVLIINAALDVVNDIYETYPMSRQKPIKSYLQVISIICSIIAFILIIAVILQKSPVKVLSGVGAMTAVIMLIFKDAILGFIASIQLAANNMVAIGDWIEMQSHGADGDVIEINLTNVKVQNFDKTITTIPSYSLVSSSFRNWKGMQQAGNRRIKRPIFIDSNSVKFLTLQEIEKFKEIEVLREYIEEKEKEIEKYNKKHKVEKSYINGRRLTNIGMLRAYIKLYLLEHPMINNNLTLLVRQQEPTPQGIPVEIYCFAKTTVWQEYEAIQSDIFEHLIPLINEFGLTVFQNPTGKDFRNYSSNY